MASRTRKHTDFVSGPMRDKPTSSLPGIGEKAAGKLVAQGYPRANMVLGQFLVLGQSREPFVSWLQSASHCNDGQAADCFQALHDWCQQFL
ncbi:barrier-to-autointegration factor-like [Amphibalanus amphitrite]|uniref:barrier-to-autointegration factor-like n=1 Tax=Amphibalanus amphitrite TaxID=1232801 RepID=UPI001C8FBD03|nr:barrier-to-autointegration factor-like [Amphibalanus amphitrite]